MNKYKVLGLAVGTAIMLSPLAALAATISNPLFSNGQTSIDATGGATVSGTFTLTVGSGEVVEFYRTQSGDMTMSPADVSVGGTLGLQEQTYYNQPFSVKVSPNTGTYTPTLQTAGIYGGGRSINGGDSVNSALTNLGTVRVVSSATSGDSTVGGTSGWEAAFAALSAKIADLTAAIAKMGSTGSTSNCPVSVYTGDNASTVQTWLITHGQSGPFAAVGVYAATGFWGNASKTAYHNALNACN